MLTHIKGERRGKGREKRKRKKTKEDRTEEGRRREKRGSSRSWKRLAQRRPKLSYLVRGLVEKGTF